jgi:hypothetical protein
MRKYKLLSIATFTAFSLWASPAMAQVSEGDDFDSFDSFGPPPAELGFYEANEYGKDCSRRRPKECTPEQRDNYNEIVAILCAAGGGAVGVIDGAIVSAILTASVVGAPAAPVAGAIHGTVVGAAAIGACYSRFKIPNPNPS